MIASTRLRTGGQLAMLLEPDQVAQEMDDYRRRRYAQGADPATVDREIRRRFGADLAALGMDEVGTPDAFGLTTDQGSPEPDLFN